MTVGIMIENLSAGYGETIVLDGISFDVAAGDTLAILGRNGVGKTTLLTTLMGLTTRHRGEIRLGCQEIQTMATHKRVHAGLGYVPQEREIFPSLTTEENLAVSVIAGGWTIDDVYELFPMLKARRSNSGNRLSGGEQQMLAVGRALVGGPKVLLLDEPMEGLAPIVIEALSEALARIRDESGLTLLLVEQRVDLALSFANNALILDRGQIVYRGTSAELMKDEKTQHRLLCIGADEE